LAKLEALEALGLMTTMFVFNLFDRYYHRIPEKIVSAPAPIFAPERFKLLMIVTVIISSALVMLFIQSRGGFTAHLASMSLGRSVAMQGAGPTSVVGKFGIIAVLLWVCFDHRTVRTPWFIACVILVAAAGFMIAGSRGEFMLAIVTPALCWALRSERLPTKLAVIVAPILLVAYGALLMIRVGTGQDERAGLSVYDRLAMSSVEDFYSAGSSEAQLRVDLRGAAPVMLDGYQTTGGPLLGLTYAPVLTWFIPRALWPEKPRGAGSVYAQNFLGATREGTSIPIGLVAEAYWNFWYPGIFAVYGFFGLAIFWAHRLFLIYGANPFVAVAYVRFMTDFSPNSEAMVPYLHTLATIITLSFITRVFAGQKRAAAAKVTRTPMLPRGG
jgi:hypothetical protein